MARFSTWRKVSILFLLGVIVGSALSGCNAVKAMGGVLEGLGKDTQNVATWTEERLHNGFKSERDDDLNYR